MNTNPERTREMRHLYDQGGLTLREIAEQFEISAERVRQLLRADGYTPRPSGFQGEPPELVEYEVEVVRVQTKRVVVSAFSKKEAKEQALQQVNWEDGLPMKTEVATSWKVGEAE